MLSQCQALFKSHFVNTNSGGVVFMLMHHDPIFTKDGAGARRVDCHGHLPRKWWTWRQTSGDWAQESVLNLHAMSPLKSSCKIKSTIFPRSQHFLLTSSPYPKASFPRKASPHRFWGLTLLSESLVSFRMKVMKTLWTPEPFTECPSSAPQGARHSTEAISNPPNHLRWELLSPFYLFMPF